ncbi:uncharacterized protein DSM5745_01703 [Aspergillus mulundensis]|uniref:Protein kinase domain-containing protein n=1 Tax=Aspergillus mulundensis TaxID=1810919 RepID=A0A3D8SVW1_9EURO|nr:Uncharacterized protein DSM5745_01703 [Aspergillus mulundensis]RDW89928.1 Uncharacterized protein DSM5745_01703 [Aspergillus mulundensis]
MDFYGTACTAIEQAYKVTVFIKGIIDDVKSFDDDRLAMRLTLNTQLSTLRTFQRLFVDPERGLLLPGKADPFVAQNVIDLLMQMRQSLAQYELIAIKYGLATTEIDALALDERTEGSLLQRAKSKAMSLMRVAYDWSLFDKKKLERLLEEYTKWTTALRDQMQLFGLEILVRGTEDDKKELNAIGLGPVVQRQKMVDAHAPDGFQDLQGEIKVAEYAANGSFQFGHWTEAGGASSTAVIVEYHEYPKKLRRDGLDPDEIAKLKAPIRDLAWLLKNSTFGSRKSKSEPEQLAPPKIYALECLGYIDQPFEDRHMFLYRLPTPQDVEMQSLITLHSYINAGDGDAKRTKPTLNDRFTMAHCLAITVQNIHASRWLHKNIWSRGILLFLDTPTGVQVSELQKHRIVPNSKNRIHAYLSDWGYARSETQGTAMAADFDAEPNLYRHPDRQGDPDKPFQRGHDIYSLGVVLLEIGLWVTMSRLMRSRISETKRTGRLPKDKEVLAELVAWAKQKLPTEMGYGYSQAVLSCLKGDFGQGDAELALNFQKVVDVLATGEAV